MINCVLIDNEASSLNLLEDHLQKTPYLKLTGKFEEPLKALPFISQENVDLLFLNIKMPDISEIDFFKSLSYKPEVIFTAANSEYAMEAFELNALDYLLKPISFQKFVSSCNRAKNFIEAKKIKPNSAKDYFFINAAHKLHKIFYHDILYMEGFKDYTKIHLKNISTPLLVLYNLKYFESMLAVNEFVRIHRSFIVPVRVLNTVSRKSVTIGNKSLPVSDNYRENLFSAIERLPNT